MKSIETKEAPAHLVSQYLLTLEGKKKFVEMVFSSHVGKP